MNKDELNKINDPVFESYKKSWDFLKNNLQHEKPEIFVVIEEGTAWLSRIIKITDGAVIINTPQVLIHEFSRIYSRTIRRFYAVNAFSHDIYIDVVVDELRSVTEMLFKVFYLLRIEKAEQFAIDARNLSAISRINAGDKLFNNGLLKRSDTDTENEEFLRKKENLLLKYKKRRPKFYADLSVSQVAEGANLLHIYDYAYGMLSSNAHNESSSEPRSLYHKNEEGAVINIIPNTESIENFAAQLSLFNQTAVLTSMAALSGFAGVDRAITKQLFLDFNTRYKNYGWDKEVETICNKFEINLSP